MKGLLLICVGVAWLAALIWSFGAPSGKAMGLGIAVGPGAPLWLAHAILKAAIITVALGWAVPLGAGIILVLRGR